MHEGGYLIENHPERIELEHTGGSGDRPHRMGVVGSCIGAALSDGAATATPAASTTTQSGATMSNIRFRIGRVLSGCGCLTARAPRDGWFGEGDTGPGGLHGRWAPGSNLVVAFAGAFSRGEAAAPVHGANGRNCTLGPNTPTCQGCGTVRPVGADAVVIGAGPNGLVAANLLADAGWQVLVLEAQPEPGGGVRSAELTHPGFVHDVFSAFYPLGVASPVMRALDLPAHGLRWRRSPIALAHPTADGRCAVLSTAIGETAQSLETYAEGDGDSWRDAYARYERIADPLLDAMTSPFPPVRGATRLGLALGPRGLLDFSRLALLSVRRLAAEQFCGEGGALLLAGNALHSDVDPSSPPSGFLGWFLTCHRSTAWLPRSRGRRGTTHGSTRASSRRARR